MAWFLSLVWWVGASCFALYLWDVAVSLAGLLPLPPLVASPKRVKFALLIPAHNESSVIAETVRNLVALEYPRDLFTVYVVADNCADNTAELARVAGAVVLERQADAGRGKGYALQWAVARIRERGGADALCIFDADNRAAPNFLEVANNHLQAGAVAIQAYLDTKNPLDTWVTRCIALAYFISNRFWFRARSRLRLAATLAGTGCCLRWDILERFPWDPSCLTDDLELTQHLLLAGETVTYTRHTRTYDEKPPRLRQSIRQRSRWMQGHNDVASRLLVPLLVAAVRRPSIRCLDAALYLLQPLRTLVAFSALAMLCGAWLVRPESLPNGVYSLTVAGLGGAVLLFVVYPLILAFTERVPWRVLIMMPVFFLFAFSWIPAIVVGLVRFRQREWAHTAHGSAAFTLPPAPPDPNANLAQEPTATPLDVKPACSQPDTAGRAGPDTSASPRGA